MSDEYKVDDLYLQQKEDARNEHLQPMKSAGHQESIMDRWERWVKAVKG